MLDIWAIKKHLYNWHSTRGQNYARAITGKCSAKLTTNANKNDTSGKTLVLPLVPISSIDPLNEDYVERKTKQLLTSYMIVIEGTNAVRGQTTF